ncbi:hypothetical protein SEVIR_4G189128v4 [Setaria viridis]
MFVSCNSTSFVASLVTIILLSPELSRHGIRSKAVFVYVVADIFCLIGAYAAGCSWDLATSLYVMFIIVIVLLCILVLARIFAYKPVADWLQKIKTDTAWCMDTVGRALFLRSNARSSNVNHQSSFASHQQDSVHIPGVPTQNSLGEYQIPHKVRPVESVHLHMKRKKQVLL